MQVLKALDVLVELARLRIGDEDHAVGALKHQLARRLVVHLSRHGIELELRREAGDRAEIERQKIEEQCAIGLRRERDHLALSLVRHLPVDVVQVRRLSGPARPVVDDLARDLAGRVVDERHRKGLNRVRKAPRGFGSIPPRSFLRSRAPRDAPPREQRPRDSCRTRRSTVEPTRVSSPDRTR